MLLKANLKNLQNAKYNKQIKLLLISKKEVRDAICIVSLFKALSFNSIVNYALQARKDLIALYLTKVFN